MREKNKLFPFLTRLPDEFDSMLFCFHHAGGSASVYFPFVNNKNDVAIIPVELPGHGSRRDEEQLVDWKQIIPDVVDQIQELKRKYNKPVRLMGCSLGSLIAFEVAAELESRNDEVAQVIICSHCSPDVESPGYKTKMGKKALVTELETLSGTDDSLMKDKEAMNFFLPVIYKDYKLHDNYEYRGNRLHDVPMKVVAGSEDPYFNLGNMKNWENMTTGDYKFCEFNGGHFFPYEKQYFSKIITDETNYRTKNC